MSFVTTQPEALAYAAGKLQTLGSGVAAESAAAAAPTTNVIPAASDEVSALQAAIFGAYGSLYQSVNAQAATVHQLFVHTLGASAGSYAATESSNSATTASPLAQRFSSFLSSAASTDPPGSGLATIANVGTGNWDSASSDLLGMCGGGILPGANETAAETSAVAGGSDGTVLQMTADSAGSGGIPMWWGSVGQPALVNSLSVPPSWAAGAVPSPASPGAVTTAGLTAPPPQSMSATAMPAGMPLAATAGRAGGMGVPRYGVKPTVMGRPTVA